VARSIRVVAVIVLSACCGVVVRAEVPADVKAIVEKAVKAAGGEKNLAKFRGMTWKEAGKYYGMGDGLDYQGKYAIEWLEKFKMDISGVFVIVYTKDKGWVRSIDSGTRDMDGDDLAEIRKNQRAGWIAWRLPLTDKNLKWTATGETRMNDRPALGVKVSQPAQRDVDLFFDKETGLLSKTETIVKSREHGNQEVKQETSYSDYKDVLGMKIATKYSLKRDGKVFVEGERSEIKMVEMFDDGVFVKPE
jgi:hypothetical protein